MHSPRRYVDSMAVFCDGLGWHRNGCTVQNSPVSFATDSFSS